MAAKSEQDKAIEMMTNLYSEIGLLNKNILVLNEGLAMLIQRLDEMSSEEPEEVEAEVVDEDGEEGLFEDIVALMGSVASLKKKIGKGKS